MYIISAIAKYPSVNSLGNAGLTERKKPARHCNSRSSYERTTKRKPLCGQSSQKPAAMLITESHQDVPTTADGKGSMRKPVTSSGTLLLQTNLLQNYTSSTQPSQTTPTPNSPASSSSVKSTKACPPLHQHL